MRKRNRRVEIYFSDEEYEELMEKVTASKLSREQFCRMVLNGAKIKEAPPAEFYKLITEIRRVGVHLNQVLKKANAGGFLDVPMIRESIEELHATQRMLYKTFRNKEPRKKKSKPDDTLKEEEL